MYIDYIEKTQREVTSKLFLILIFEYLLLKLRYINPKIEWNTQKNIFVTLRN